MRNSRRRLLTFAGILALLFGLAMLHPYPRQSLFGPKIDGVPWCIWENKIRHAATPFWEKSMWIRTLEKAGMLDVRRDIPNTRG